MHLRRHAHGRTRFFLLICSQAHIIWPVAEAKGFGKCLIWYFHTRSLSVYRNHACANPRNFPKPSFPQRTRQKCGFKNNIAQLTSTCARSWPMSCEPATTSLSAIQSSKSSISLFSWCNLRVSSNFPLLSSARSLRPAYSLSTWAWRILMSSLQETTCKPQHLVVDKGGLVRSTSTKRKRWEARAQVAQTETSVSQ